MIVLDDLEYSRRDQAQDVFARYRRALDSVLGTCGFEAFGSVHFLVMMLEAYYFACPAVLKAVLGIEIPAVESDVELIPHPKNNLKSQCHGFDEKAHGRQIVPSLDMAAVLGNPQTCASMRTLFAWCIKAMGGTAGERFQLAEGVLFPATKDQLDLLSL